jgi:hypothetical protein
MVCQRIICTCHPAKELVKRCYSPPLSRDQRPCACVPEGEERGFAPDIKSNSSRLEELTY